LQNLYLILKCVTATGTEIHSSVEGKIPSLIIEKLNSTGT